MLQDVGHTHRSSLVFKKKKKKNQVKSPSPESRVPETGSDPPIGSGRDSGRDIYTYTPHAFSMTLRFSILPFVPVHSIPAHS